MSCNCSGNGKISVKRGATKDVSLTVTFDLTAFDEVRVTFAQKGRTVTKTKDQIELEERGGATNVTAHLSQADTLRFEPGKAFVQIRYSRGDYAGATDIGVLFIEPVLEEGAI